MRAPVVLVLAIALVLVPLAPLLGFMWESRPLVAVWFETGSGGIGSVSAGLSEAIVWFPLVMLLPCVLVRYALAELSTGGGAAVGKLARWHGRVTKILWGIWLVSVAVAVAAMTSGYLSIASVRIAVSMGALILISATLILIAQLLFAAAGLGVCLTGVAQFTPRVSDR